jgi:hypothetical protein
LSTKRVTRIRRVAILMAGAGLEFGLLGAEILSKIETRSLIVIMVVIGSGAMVTYYERRITRLTAQVEEARLEGIVEGYIAAVHERIP